MEKEKILKVVENINWLSKDAAAEQNGVILKEMEPFHLGFGVNPDIPSSESPYHTLRTDDRRELTRVKTLAWYNHAAAEQALLDKEFASRRFPRLVLAVARAILVPAAFIFKKLDVVLKDYRARTENIWRR